MARATGGGGRLAFIADEALGNVPHHWGILTVVATSPEGLIEARRERALA
jgi:hypothetical protein